MCLQNDGRRKRGADPREQHRRVEVHVRRCAAGPVLPGRGPLLPAGGETGPDVGSQAEEGGDVLLLMLRLRAGL